MDCGQGDYCCRGGLVGGGIWVVGVDVGVHTGAGHWAAPVLSLLDPETVRSEGPIVIMLYPPVLHPQSLALPSACTDLQPLAEQLPWFEDLNLSPSCGVH